MATAPASVAEVGARITAFADEVVRPAAAAMARGEGDGGRTLVTEAGRRGLAGMLVPVELGGVGGSHADFTALIEAVAQQCASSAVVLDVHESVASEPLLLLGNDDQRRRYLPRLACGEWVGAFALSEPASGSDAASLETRAERRGRGYRLTGTKMWISNGGIADLYLVMARTGGRGAGGISAFLVEAAWPGVRPGRPLHKLGLRGSRTCELVLDGVEVPEANRVGDEGSGFRLAMAALDSGRIGISAQAVGIAQGALDDVVSHLVAAGHAVDDVALLDERAAAGMAQSLGRLGELAAWVATARALMRHAAAVCDAGQPLTRPAAIAKLVATDTCVAAAHLAVELCAPASASEAHPSAIRLRDAKACQIYEGTNQVQRIVIARELMRA